MDAAAMRRALFDLIGEVRYRNLVRWLNLDPQDEHAALLPEPWLCWRWFCETYPDQEITIPEFRRLLRVCAEHDCELLPGQVFAPSDRVNEVRTFTGFTGPWPNARVGVDPERWRLSPTVTADVWYCPVCRQARAEAEQEGYTGWERATTREEIYSGGPPSVHSERLRRLLADHRQRADRIDPIDPKLAASLGERYRARPDVQARVRAVNERHAQLFEALDIRLIPTPAFAPEHARRGISFEGLSEASAKLLGGCRPQILARLQAAVERKLNDAGTIEERYFPYLGCMTGEYYIDKERYEWRSDGPWVYQVGFYVRCPGTRNGKLGDYCGLDIVLRFTPDLGECEEVYAGHAVI